MNAPKNGKFYFIEIKESSLVITLNRPEVKNAFNASMILELLDLFKEIENQKSIKIVILKSNGEVFCAGADLNWMREMKKYSLEENEIDARQLEKLFSSIRFCKFPVIGLIQGGCFGGGVGLAAACDIVYAKQNSATFCLSEVKLGLVPAVISPFVISKIGAQHFRNYALTGESFDALRAKEIGLVNNLVDPKDWESLTQMVDQKFQTLPAMALQKIKSLSNKLTDSLFSPATTDYTTKLIAQVRLSAEAQEGMSALLEKRSPKFKGQK